MANKCRNVFFGVAVYLLLLTSLGKIFSVVRGAALILDQVDLLLGIQYKQLMLMAATLECSAAVYCLFAKSHTIKAVTLLSVSFVFFSYRILQVMFHAEFPCNCLGSIAEALAISDSTADIISKIILAYLTVGSSLVIMTRRPDNS